MASFPTGSVSAMVAKHVHIDALDIDADFAQKRTRKQVLYVVDKTSFLVSRGPYEKKPESVNHLSSNRCFRRLPTQQKSHSANTHNIRGLALQS